jgi:hypothetical protein
VELLATSLLTSTSRLYLPLRPSRHPPTRPSSSPSARNLSLSLCISVSHSFASQLFFLLEAMRVPVHIPERAKILRAYYSRISSQSATLCRCAFTQARTCLRVTNLYEARLQSRVLHCKLSIVPCVFMRNSSFLFPFRRWRILMAKENRWEGLPGREKAQLGRARWKKNVTVTFADKIR